MPGSWQQNDLLKRLLRRFEELLVSSQWDEEYVDGQKIWVCRDDAQYQIEPILTDYRKFAEPWTEWGGFASKETLAHEVNLKIGNGVVKQVVFISLDDGRYFVPQPEVEQRDGKPHYFWKQDSLEFRLGRLIGIFYITRNIFDFAETVGIEIR